MDFLTIFCSFVGGILPPLIWLYFILREDTKNPEPRTILVLAFIAGMLAVFPALFLEQLACVNLATNPASACALGSVSFHTLGLRALTAWALIEEALKYIVAALFIFWRPAVDESLDYVIYMITVALGFAAIENIFFIAGPLTDGHVALSVLTGSTRFVGSTLAHVIASAALGFALAFSSKGHPFTRVLAGAAGLILAILLHTTFNALIINASTSITSVALFFVWIVMIVFFAMFEVLKYFQYRSSNS